MNQIPLRELSTTVPIDKRVYCTVCLWLQTRPQDDRDFMTEWVAANRPVSHLHKLAVAQGYPNKVGAFHKHFRECEVTQ